MIMRRYRVMVEAHCMNRAPSVTCVTIETRGNEETAGRLAKKKVHKNRYPDVGLNCLRVLSVREMGGVCTGKQNS